MTVTPGPEPEGLTAADLSGKHLGRWVSFAAANARLEGVLSGVEHKADLVSDATWMDPDRVVLGRSRVWLTFPGWTPSPVPPETPVLVYRGPR